MDIIMKIRLVKEDLGKFLKLEIRKEIFGP
jgi:hypothetical protein